MEKNFTINAEKYSIRCKAFADDWKQPKTVILFGHGFGGSKDTKSLERFAKRTLEKNKGVLILGFDWPCHGEDAVKKLSLALCGTYLRLVLEYIEDNYAPERLLGYATSFGAYLFLRWLLESGNPFEALALRCPAVCMYDTFTGKILTEEDFEKLKKSKPVSVGFDRKIEITRAFLDELQEGDIRKHDFFDFADEMLILHGTKDELIPIDEAAAFADDNCIEFVPIENADHRFQDPKKMELAIAQILKFFSLR